MRLVRSIAALLLAAFLASGCSSGCSQEMDHGGTNPDSGGGAQDAAAGGDGGLPLCPDAGPPTCRYPWDAGAS